MAARLTRLRFIQWLRSSPCVCSLLVGAPTAPFVPLAELNNGARFDLCG